MASQYGCGQGRLCAECWLLCPDPLGELARPPVASTFHGLHAFSSHTHFTGAQPCVGVPRLSPAHTASTAGHPTSVPDPQPRGGSSFQCDPGM